jgi:plastocyanin
MKGFLNKPRTLAILTTVALAAFALAGCAVQAAPEPVSYKIDMTEFAFTPEVIQVKVGQQVTLDLVNGGKLAHEIMFGKDVMMMNDRPSGYMQDMFMQAGVEPEVMGPMESGEHMQGMQEHTGFMVLLNKPGEQASMTFTVTEKMVGEWEMGCFEQDGVHYQAGMIGKMIVSR